MQEKKKLLKICRSVLDIHPDIHVLTFPFKGPLLHSNLLSNANIVEYGAKWPMSLDEKNSLLQQNVTNVSTT